MTDAPQKIDRRRKPERKVEILQAVMEILEEGESRVTTAALAQRMKLSEAALYRHFPNKAAIFMALVDYIEDHLLRPINQVLVSGDHSVAQLGRLLEYHLGFLKEHPGLCRIFLVEGVAREADGITQRMTQVVRKYHAQVKQIIRRGQAAGEISERLNVEIAAQMYVGMLQSRALLFVLSGFKDPPDAEWEAAWSLFHRAISLDVPA